MNKNRYSFDWCNVFRFGSGITVGNVIGSRGDRNKGTYEDIQEHTETTYAIGWLRIIVSHSHLFVKF